ncbi:MAG: hypothetical protein AB8B55_13225 [Mariniblastus sp.]
MKKQDKQLPQHVASYSIDHWQDDESVSGNWLDKPIWGVLIMGCAAVGLFGLSTISGASGNSNQTVFAGSEPVPMMPHPDDPSLENEARHESANLNSPPWTTPADETGSNDARLTGDVSDLLTELVEADQNGRSSYEIKQELSRNGCSDTEIVRHLAKRLRDIVDARNFERILLAITGISYVISDNPDIKQQFVGALAAAGQHVQTSQLKEMDQRVTSLILDSTQLPESVDLLGKLASIDDNWGHQVLTKLYRLQSDIAPEISVKIARENKLNPQHLRDKDSEAVCQFLWEGKLAGKENFLSVSIGDSEASIKAFSNAAAAKIDNDPSGAVDSLMALSLNRQSGISRMSLSKELMQKIDSVMSTNVEKHFVDTDESIHQASKRGRKGTGPFAFLDLAEHLGGRKTIIALAKTGIDNQTILEKFQPIRDILASVNEPKTYHAIVVATGFHGIGRSNAIRENIGQAIEPNFLRRLKVELRSQPTKREKNDWVKRISHLVEAIDQIGTSKSLPVLGQLAKNKNGLLKGLAERTLKKIRKRSVADTKPTKEIETQPIKVSTDSGEAFKSSINNIVQGKIPRSRIQDKLSFDPGNMWHSDKLESGWATIELEFPERVTLDKIQIYSQHTGKNHLVVAAKVFTVAGRESKLLVEAEGLKQDDSLRFPSAESKKWKLKLQAGKSKKVVIRGLRFFDSERELYPPTELPSAK